EANENFLVTLTGATNAALGNSVGTATIINDDAATNTPPAITSAAIFTVAENTLGVTTVTALETDPGQVLTWSIVPSAGGGGVDAARFSIDGVTGVLAFIANPDFEIATDAGGDNVYNVTVAVSDGAGGSDTQALAITVANVNESVVTQPSDIDPAINTVTENAAIGTRVGIAASAGDTDASDTVGYALSINPGGLFAISAATGIVTVASTIDRESAGASVDIEVTASSTDGSTAARIFTIAIGDADEFDVTAPADINAAINSVAENSLAGQAAGIRISATDADATTNALTYALTDSAGGRFVIDPTSGIVTVAAGAVLDYETAAAHQITVAASSADGSTATASFTISVGDVNEAPVTRPGTAGTSEDAAVTFDPRAFVTDPDNDPLTLTAVSALHGAAIINLDGTVTYTPDANYNGPDALSYSVSDGRSGAATGTVAISIAPVNDAAVIAGVRAGTVTEDGTQTASGLLNVTDADGAAEAPFLPGAIAGAYGSLVLAGNGAWTYTLDNASAAVQALNAGQSVVDNIAVRTFDGTPSSIAITIAGTNEATGVISNGNSGGTLTGTNGADVFDGAGGNDIIIARGGNDTIVATTGDGNDAYFGGGGTDVFDFSQITTGVMVNLGTTVFGFTINGTGTASGSQTGTDLLWS
ncbi:MAG: VCBS domain-containing protein, partial [Vicinamibacterales bacterium]